MEICNSYLNLKWQTIDRAVELNMSDYTPEWLEKIPTILRYNHKTKTYNEDLDFYFSANDWKIQVDYKDGAFSVSYLASPKNAYYGNSGDIVSGQLYSYGLAAQYSAFKVKLLFDSGDANFINGVNAEDLQATILYAFDEYTQPFNFTAANTYDKDEVINVQDVVCTVNLLLASPAEVRSKSKSRKETQQEEAEETDAAVYIRDGKVILNTRTPIAALNIKASGKIYWDVAQYGMTQSTKESNLVGYSLSGATLPTGEIVIGTCAADADIRSVSLADNEAKAISVSYGEDTPTSITHINGNGSVHIYDLSGRKQMGLKTGVNIVNKNGKTIKVINK